MVLKILELFLIIFLVLLGGFILITLIVAFIKSIIKQIKQIRK